MSEALGDKDILSTGPGSVCRKDEKGAYLFDLDSGKLNYINTLGVFVYEQCDGMQTVGEIIRLVQERYPEQPVSTIRNNVLDFLNKLMGMTFLEKH